MFRDLRGLLALALLLAAIVFIGLAALGVGAMTVSALTATSAKAECDIFHCDPPRRKVRRHYRRRAPERDVRYYAPPSYRDDGPDVTDCKAPVRGLGTQYVGEAGALEAAMKDWRERVRYDIGEKWMDAQNALDFQKRCGRTSIGEVAGQVFYRCEIIARPCKAEFSHAEGMR
jgi:hypothetical protein